MLLIANIFFFHFVEYLFLKIFLVYSIIYFSQLKKLNHDTAFCYISYTYLVSTHKQTGLSLSWSHLDGCLVIIRQLQHLRQICGYVPLTILNENVKCRYFCLPSATIAVMHFVSDRSATWSATSVQSATLRRPMNVSEETNFIINC